MVIEEIVDAYSKLEGISKLREIIKKEKVSDKMVQDNLIALLTMMQRDILEEVKLVYLSGKKYDISDSRSVTWSRMFEYSILSDRGVADEEKEKELKLFLDTCSKTREVCE
jgi:hypothetical protein